MARFDRFDRLTLVGLILCGVVLTVLFVTGSVAKNRTGELDKALERQLAYQARVDFLLKLYRPVEDLRSTGQVSSALLKLDEIARTYPQEAHGEILRGEILLERGAIRQAVEHYVRAVRLNGDYIDKASLLSRRAEISRLVKTQLPLYAERAREDPQSLILQNTLTDLYYLQSRLAGGCE